MLYRIKRITTKIGIDGPIGYTVLTRIIQAGGSFFSLYLIALYLTKEEQGFYYTFSSILALQVFFELGFNNVITQFAAHEMVHISTFDISVDRLESKAQSRLASLLYFCFAIFLKISLVLFFALLFIGYFFFNKFGVVNAVNWQLPWLILVINTSLSFIISPLFSFLEGIGRIKQTAKLRLLQQIINLIILWTMLINGGKLYSAPISGLCSLLVVVFVFIFSDFRTVLLKIWKLLGQWKINYRIEIFPYQWKISISWISGYFIFQLFNPVLFATDGPMIAGQMGIVLALLNGINSLSLSWMSTKVSQYSNLVALKEYKKLDSVFNTTLRQVSIINGSLLVLMFLTIYFIKYYKITVTGNVLGERFLDYGPLVLMMGALFLNQFVSSWAIYLRCHNKEPYLVFSIVTGILCLTSTIVFGNFFGVIGITLGYFIITLLSLVWANFIFINCKNKWHL
ncbi:hypothetical protein LV89_03703 [Arcicella aurantiaca]|uniref:O-antigen/teichoic acid export membrane protein n=1 Tax=Arcicella aurantiaca TaxID=591202 RepID=A0A316EEK8_9BACT|nr:hypothetical protein [Arcicella aurantiaca]PWK21410.1 hypothetical protein LV89_03703 [Arcicella aurantiaca]